MNMPSVPPQTADSKGKKKSGANIIALTQLISPSSLTTALTLYSEGPTSLVAAACAQTHAGYSHI
ncbi:hypothetical protein AZE42_13042, partial [Rhizopogon vesiculosus]